jgi:hypothetical protein
MALVVVDVAEVYQQEQRERRTEGISPARF